MNQGYAFELQKLTDCWGEAGKVKKYSNVH